MAFTVDKSGSSGRVLQPQDRLGVFLSGVETHTNDGGGPQTEATPFQSRIRDGYAIHLLLDDFKKQVESASYALSMLHESSVGQQRHAIFASDLRRLSEALGRMSTTYAGIEVLSWDQELWDSAQKCEQGLEPLFMLLPRDIRLVLLKNPAKQTILQKVAAWASKEDEFCRVQLELASGIEPITSRLDLVNSEKHGDPTLAIDTVSEDTRTATCTDPSRDTTVTETSSLATFANVASGVLGCERSRISGSVVASRRQRSPSHGDSFQNGPQGADPNRSHHWLQKSVGGGTRRVSCGEVSDRCDEAKNLGRGKIPRFHCTAHDLASLGPANDCTIGSWTGSSLVLPGNLETWVPSSLQLEIKLESEGISSCVGQGSQANREPPLGECGRLGSECSTLDRLFSFRTEVCPQMAKQVGDARHSRSYLKGRWLQRSGDDPWNAARPTGKWFSYRTDDRSNLSGIAESQRPHGHVHRAGYNNHHVEAVAGLGPSGPSEDDSIAGLFKDLSLRQNSDGKRPPTQPVGCANGAQESPAPPHGSCGGLGPSDNVRGKRKAGENNRKGKNGDGDSGSQDGDSGREDDPGRQPRIQRVHPRDFAGYLPCIYRDLARDLECSKLWPDLDQLKKHLKSCKHNKKREEMKVCRGGTNVETWKRIYEKLRGEPAPNPFEWMVDMLIQAMQRSYDNSRVVFDHSIAGDDSRHSEQSSSVPLRESFDGRFVALPEEAAPMSQSAASDQMSNTHVLLPSQNTINPWGCHTRGHTVYTNQSDTPELAQNYQPPMYKNGPVDAPVDQLQPATSMFALTSDPRIEEPMSEGHLLWTSTSVKKNLTKPPQADTGFVMDTAYPGSDTRSQSAPNSRSDPSLLTAPTSWGEDLPVWGQALSNLEGCTCLQHIASCVDDYHKGEFLCRGCGKMMPLFREPGFNATLPACQ